MPILEKVRIFIYLAIFQMTPTTAATAAARRQFFHLARALAHSVQGWNIPFGNPSLRWCLSIFIAFHQFLMISIENHMFIYGNWARMTAEWSRIFLKLILVLETNSKVNFGPQNWNFHFSGKSNFQFSSITNFLGHEIQDPTCRICSYGPHGPFWFSVKKWPDTVKRYQKNENGEKSVFEIIAKMN